MAPTKRSSPRSAPTPPLQSQQPNDIAMPHQTGASPARSKALGKAGMLNAAIEYLEKDYKAQWDPWEKHVRSKFMLTVLMDVFGVILLEGMKHFGILEGTIAGRYLCCCHILLCLLFISRSEFLRRRDKDTKALKAAANTPEKLKMLQERVAFVDPSIRGLDSLFLCFDRLRGAFLMAFTGLALAEMLREYRTLSEGDV